MFSHILMGLLVLVVSYLVAWFWIMAFVRYAVTTYDKEKNAPAGLPELLKKVLTLAMIARIPVVNVVMGVFLLVIWLLSILSTEVQTNRQLLKELQARVKT